MALDSIQLERAHRDHRLALCGPVMEPPLCEWGNGLERARLACEEHLHLTDPRAQAPCGSCGKTWCRVCHGPICPRRKRVSSGNG